MKFYFLLLVILLTSCSSAEKEEKMRLSDLLKNHQIRNRSYFEKSFTKKPHMRVTNNIPAEVKEFIGFELELDKYFKRKGWNGLEYSNDKKFLSSVRTAVKKMPKELQKYFQSLGAVYVLKKGPATNAFYTRDKGHWVLFISEERFNTSSNEWCRKFILQGFQKKGKYSVQCEMEEKGSTPSVAAIQYLLMRIVADFVTEENKIFPKRQSKGFDMDVYKYPFLKVSWDKKDGYLVYKNRLPLNAIDVKKLSLRPHEDLTTDQLPDFYNYLEKTTFTNLYGLRSSFGDFQESLANYFHVKVMKRPYTVKIMEGSRVVKEYKHCWDQARCAEKAKLYLDYFKL